MPLIDRIAAAERCCPGLPLALLCVCVGDSRPEVVATLRRMVQLAAGRASVTASTKPTATPTGTCPHDATRPAGSLPLSSRDTGCR